MRWEECLVRWAWVRRSGRCGGWASLVVAGASALPLQRGADRRLRRRQAMPHGPRCGCRHGRHSVPLPMLLPEQTAAAGRVPAHAASSCCPFGPAAQPIELHAGGCWVPPEAGCHCCSWRLLPPSPAQQVECFGTARLLHLQHTRCPMPPAACCLPAHARLHGCTTHLCWPADLASCTAPHCSLSKLFQHAPRCLPPPAAACHCRCAPKAARRECSAGCLAAAASPRRGGNVDGRAHRQTCALQLVQQHATSPA